MGSTLVSSPNSNRIDSDLWGVTAFSNTVWAVGKGSDKYDNGRPWDTLVERLTCAPPPTVTGTPPTATRTATNLPSATPTTCSLQNTSYTIAQSTGATVIPATTDSGLHCDSCATTVALPFQFSLYGQPFSQVIAGSNGTLGFVSNSNTYNTTCLPSQAFDYAILPYWQELHLSNQGGGCPNCGIFTSVEGAAPNRVFNIEWRASDYFYTSFVNVEVRLYETSANSQFDVIYGSVPSGTNQQVTVGVQKGQGFLYTQFVCSNTSFGTITNGTKLVFGQPTCNPTGTSTTTATASPIVSRTATVTATASRAATNAATNTSMPVSTATTALQTTTATRTPTSSPTLCTISFTDVPPGSTFYPYIQCLACKDIISGYGDNTFRPQNNVTRGQAAKILANSAGYNENIPSTQQTFLDVPVNSTFWVYIERVALHEAISGYACGSPGEPCPGAYFRPQNNMTRGQLAKVDAGVRGYNESIPSTQQTFLDVPINSTFWVYIERAALHGVISGYACGGVGEPCPGAYFRPGNLVTRGQTAKIVSNTFFPNCGTQTLR